LLCTIKIFVLSGTVLKTVESEKVLLHEASRPFFTSDFVQSLFKHIHEKAMDLLIMVEYSLSDDAGVFEPQSIIIYVR